MNRVRSWVRWSALVLVVGGVGPTSGQQTSTESDFPMVGVGAGQIFRFAVGSVQDPSRVGDAPQRCQAMLSFNDIRNRPIGTSLQVDLGPNETAYHDLDPRTLGLRAKQRIDFRPVLTVSAQSGGCHTSFNVLAASTGQLLGYPDPPDVLKHYIETAPQTCGILEQPDDLHLIHLGSGQTAQLAVVRSTKPVDVNNMPLPCDVILQIRKWPGPVVVASQPTGPLMPGHAAMVSANVNMFRLGFGETALLSLEVLAHGTNVVFPGDPPLACPATTNIGCKPSIQVMENFSQWTTALVTPK